MTSYHEGSEKFSKHIWDKRSDLLLRVRLGVSYHRKRERFFDTLDKITKAIALLGASSVLASLAVGQSEVVVQVAIVLSSTLALVLDWSNRARDHSDLAVRYSQLDRDIAAAGEQDFTDQHLAQWEAKFCEIEAIEPPSLHGLIQICQDEFDMAAGKVVERERLSIWRRFRAHFGFGSMPGPTQG